MIESAALSTSTALAATSYADDLGTPSVVQPRGTVLGYRAFRQLPGLLGTGTGSGECCSGTG